MKLDKLKMQSEEHCDVKGRKVFDDDMEYTSEDEIFMNPMKEVFSCLHRVDDEHVKVFNIESPEKDSEVTFEQNVPECDLPELIVCYKENPCNIVKDISIDEGTMPSPSPSPIQVVFENDEHENDQNDELMKKALQIADIALDNEFKNTEQSLSEKVPSVGVDRDLEYRNTKQTVELEPCDENINDNDGVEDGTVQASSTVIENPAKSTLVYDCEDSETEAEKLTPKDLYPVPILEEVRDDGISNNDLSYNSKVENESITFNFSSLQSSSKEKTKVPENGANLKERSNSEMGKLPKIEDGLSSQIQLGIGESSSRLVNFSGPVAYSGSLSIRSDSSTTSTRSFAFPMLQADWHHSSPVRMAKADRRFFRKERGWRHGLFCCRF